MLLIVKDLPIMSKALNLFYSYTHLFHKHLFWAFIRWQTLARDKNVNRKDVRKKTRAVIWTELHQLQIMCYENNGDKDRRRLGWGDNGYIIYFPLEVLSQRGEFWISNEDCSVKGFDLKHESTHFKTQLLIRIHLKNTRNISFENEDQAF